MTKKPEKREPIIDWEPAPGFLLCKPLKREELAKLYDRDAGSLQMPDRMGKVSDSVGAGIVIRTSDPSVEDIELAMRVAKASLNEKSGLIQHTIEKFTAMHLRIHPGDYVAWMPFTDALIEIDGVKYSLIGYDKIRAVRKGASE